jgi:hypothetical protein
MRLRLLLISIRTMVTLVLQIDSPNSMVLCDLDPNGTLLQRTYCHPVLFDLPILIY